MDITAVDCVEQAAIRQCVIDRCVAISLSPSPCTRGESSPLRRLLDRDVRERTNGARDTFSFTIIYTTQYYWAKENIFGRTLNTCKKVDARCKTHIFAANSYSALWNERAHFSDCFSLWLVSLWTTALQRRRLHTQSCPHQPNWVRETVKTMAN